MVFGFKRKSREQRIAEQKREVGKLRKEVSTRKALQKLRTEKRDLRAKRFKTSPIGMVASNLSKSIGTARKNISANLDRNQKQSLPSMQQSSFPSAGTSPLSGGRSYEEVVFGTKPKKEVANKKGKGITIRIDR